MAKCLIESSVLRNPVLTIAQPLAIIKYEYPELNNYLLEKHKTEKIKLFTTIKMKFNLYEKLYLGIYSFLSRTNKSIPEWSTIICISTLLFMNVISIFTLINSDFKGLGKGGFQLMILIFISLNWFYFLKKNRIIKKLVKVKYELKMGEKVVIGIYCFGSILLLFIILEMGIKLTLTTFGGFLILMFLVYEFGEKPIKFK